MVEYTATRLGSFSERFAEVLAEGVIGRGRKGFYRAYVDRNGELPYLSGRININHLARRPWSVRRECAFQEHTPDVNVNQVLAWTLFLIARTGLCSGYSTSNREESFSRSRLCHALGVLNQKTALIETTTD